MEERRTRRHMAVGGAACAALLLGLACFAVISGDDRPSELSGVKMEEGVKLPKMQLWESADSPAHDPYYNIFEYHHDSQSRQRSGRSNEDAHTHWSGDAVRTGDSQAFSPLLAGPSTHTTSYTWNRGRRECALVRRLAPPRRWPGLPLPVSSDLCHGFVESFPLPPPLLQSQLGGFLVF